MQVDHQQDFGNNAIFLDTLKRNQKNVTAIENSNDCTKKKEISAYRLKTSDLKNSSIKKFSAAEFRPLQGKVSRRLPWWL